MALGVGLVDVEGRWQKQNSACLQGLTGGRLSSTRSARLFGW